MPRSTGGSRTWADRLVPWSSTPVRLLADGRLRAVRLPSAVLSAQVAHARVRWARPGRDMWDAARCGGLFGALELRVPRRVRGGPACGGRGRWRCCRAGCRHRRGRTAGRADAFQGLLGRGLHEVRVGPDLGVRCRGAARWGRYAGGGRVLDGHAAGDGRDGHGDQERCGGRGSVHPRNSGVSGALWGAEKRRMPRTGERPVGVPRPARGLSRRWTRRCAHGAGRRGRCGGRTPRSCG